MSKQVDSFIGEKLEQAQIFDQQGKRVPVTVVAAYPCTVVRVLTEEKDGYNALQLGIGIKKEKRTTKPILGQIKKAGLKKIPRFLQEIRLKDSQATNMFKAGDEIRVGDVFKVGDSVDVTGVSWGKGFTGVVKRHHFKGGPRTHGQSDRERAPGSIGQTTRPGRVYKGKRMAGRSGNQKVTIKNLKVIEVDDKNNRLVISGLVPGKRDSLLTIRKMN